jgi:hypothetical protein
MRGVIFAMCLICPAHHALACSSAIRPALQTAYKFYDRNAYGRLGIVNDQYVRILDEYRCYDLSFLSNRYLSIYFNNAKDGDIHEPTYVGAVIVRVFRSGTYGDGPFSAYLYRNTTNVARRTSKFAHGSIEQGAIVSAAELRILPDEYNPDEGIQASSFAQLDQLLRFGSQESEAKLKDWHSLVVAPRDDKYFVHGNTAKSNTSWVLDNKLKDSTGSYLIVRNYLVKYQTSDRPQPEVYFQTGAAGADCVYIRLVAPGDGASSFAIGGSGQFITLKMRYDAICVDPN